MIREAISPSRPMGGPSCASALGHRVEAERDRSGHAHGAARDVPQLLAAAAETATECYWGSFPSHGCPGWARFSAVRSHS